MRVAAKARARVDARRIDTCAGAVVVASKDRTNATLVKTFDFLDSKNLLNMVVGGMWTDSSIVLCTLNGDIIQVPSPSAGAEPEPEAEGECCQPAS
jgi:hypothetical protein